MSENKKIKTSSRIREAEDINRAEMQDYNMARELARSRLRDGTASDTLICTYLKMGSRESRLKAENLEAENALLKAKVRSLDSQMKQTVDQREVLEAIGLYRAEQEEDYDD